jgi:peptidoglycan/xylan/chitin deacetylase (PgdA/CDA1 family)
MLGRSVERHPGVARAVLARGHEIGNHSYSHPRMVFMSPAAIRDEIERTDRLLRDIGVTGDIHFRAPHLSKLVILPYVLRQLGKVSVLADVDAEEWRGRPVAEMTPEVLDRVRPGSIVMMHDTAGDQTVRMLGDVIAALSRDGFRFEPVGMLIERRRRGSR